MKHPLFLALLLSVAVTATAQLKPRPDAFPPDGKESVDPKAVSMASSVSQMASWDRYPTYSTYVAMMQQWAADFPALCRLDTIGTSIQGRLILCMEIAGNQADSTLPEFFYSSTIHGDEVTGYVMMLRLIDTLLNGYGNNPQYTRLVNTTRIYINPLANPDGTYYQGNHTVQGSRRYNANNVDLNRNYPNPFGSSQSPLQPENQAMINYVSSHHFRLSANLHGGAEVMNYPWDSFTSAQNPHPKSAWWQEVCKRFVDTARTYSNNHFRDTYSCGYTAGGDWYVIDGGRQDYMNYYHNCLELTMEISTTKTLSSNQLPTYWDFLQHSLVNYIEAIRLYEVTVGEDTAMGRVEGSGMYWEGDTVTMTAIPRDGYRFSHWNNGSTDNPQLFLVESDTQWIAVFEPLQRYVVVDGNEGDTAGQLQGCGTYWEGDSVTLRAQPYEGFRFSHWQDSVTDNPRRFVITCDTVFTAYFVADTGTHSAIVQGEAADDVRLYVHDGHIIVEALEPTEVRVYDMMGREVLNSGLRKGVYLVRTGLSVRKVVVM